MGNAEHNEQLFDMHCHLGFVPDAETAHRCLACSGIEALSCTVSPAEYERNLRAFAEAEGCTVALGLHPWQVTESAEVEVEAELARFQQLAPTTRFIGEVGLDYAGARGEPSLREFQREVFDQVLAACDAPSTAPRKLLSLHAVRAAGDGLDLLEERGTLARHDCIFHWFAGTSDELKRAIDAGCFFSVGPRMLATKRGREYARVIPLERLLLETDSPARPGEAWDCARWTRQLTEAAKTIAALRNVSAAEVARSATRTSQSLLRRA